MRPNIKSIFLKIFSLSEYQIRRTTFINDIFNFNHSQTILSSKWMLNFWQLCIKKSHEIQKILLIYLSGYKNGTVEFHLTHCEIPWPSLHYYKFLSFSKLLWSLFIIIFNISYIMYNLLFSLTCWWNTVEIFLYSINHFD